MSRPRPLTKIVPVALAATLVLGAVLGAVGGVAEAGQQKPPARPPLPRLRLDPPGSSTLALLDAFRDAEVERPGNVRLYLGGRWGRWEQTPWMELSFLGGAPVASSPVEQWTPPEDAWSFSSAVSSPVTISFAAPLATSMRSAFAGSIDFDALWGGSTRTEAAPVAQQRTCWRRPVTFVRYGAETDTFALVGCDGSVAPEALDRLSLMARPPEVPRSGELLPDEPDDAAWARGEWIDSVRPVNARLLWLLQRIADGFPRRTIYIFSGYRPKGSSGKSQHSMHGEARAMDISVYGIRNEDLFRFCRTLDDVGCGYYPNSKFVHVDVRRPRTGHAFWVDASGPGQPSRYVDAWPGVVESGALVWDRKASDQARERGRAADSVAAAAPDSSLGGLVGGLDAGAPPASDPSEAPVDSAAAGSVGTPHTPGSAGTPSAQ